MPKHNHYVLNNTNALFIFLNYAQFIENEATVLITVVTNYYREQSR